MHFQEPKASELENAIPSSPFSIVCLEMSQICKKLVLTKLQHMVQLESHYQINKRVRIQNTISVTAAVLHFIGSPPASLIIGYCI